MVVALCPSNTGGTVVECTGPAASAEQDSHEHRYAWVLIRGLMCDTGEDLMLTYIQIPFKNA